jgi:hypothetical protein
MIPSLLPITNNNDRTTMDLLCRFLGINNWSSPQLEILDETGAMALRTFNALSESGLDSHYCERPHERQPQNNTYNRGLSCDSVLHTIVTTQNSRLETCTDFTRAEDGRIKDRQSAGRQGPNDWTRPCP